MAWLANREPESGCTREALAELLEEYLSASRPWVMGEALAFKDRGMTGEVLKKTGSGGATHERALDAGMPDY